MTEQEWLASKDPAAMLDFAKTLGQKDCECGCRVGDRRLRLFAVACARLHAHDVNGWEEWAARDVQPPGTFSPEAGARHWCGMKVGQHHPIRLSRGQKTEQAHLLRDIVGSPWRPWLCRRCARGPASLVLADSGVAFACQGCAGKHYRTPNEIRSLAQAALDERDPATGHLDPARLAILADILEEAGCPLEVECPECKGQGQYWLPGFRGPRTTLACCETCPRGEYGAPPDYGHRGSGQVPHPLLAHLRSPGPHVCGCWAVDLVLGNG